MPAVLRIITRLNIGGPSIQATRLTTELGRRGYTTVLLHGRLGPGEGDMRYLLPDASVDVRPIDALQRSIAPLADVRAFRSILSILHDVKPDIVHTHMAKAGLLGRLAALGYNLARPRGRRALVVHTYHGHVLEGYFGGWQTGIFIRLERLLARVTDKLIAISPRICDDLVDRFRIAPRGQFAVVPLGFDLADLSAIDDAARAAARAALGISADALVVSTVGRLTKIKNHGLLFDAVRRVVMRRPQLIVLIAGGGELRSELERQVTELGIADRVRFLGWRRDLPTIYGATDVFILTSQNEGTPVALIEAMAAGVPGVATNVGGVPDVITDPGAGVLVPPDDSAALAAALDELLDSAASRKAMGARARASVVKRYDMHRLVSDIDALYRLLLSRDAAPHLDEART